MKKTDRTVVMLEKFELSRYKSTTSYSELTDLFFQAVTVLRVKVELIVRLRPTMKETAPPEWSGNITTQLRLGKSLEDDNGLSPGDCLTKRFELCH